MTKVTILLVDDEAAVRRFVGKVLRARGYEVLEAQDGLEALELSDQRGDPIHLLLTDWQMPRLDGGSLIRELASRRPETAFLVISGFLDGRTPDDIPVLLKPFTPAQLVSKVQDVLRSGRDRGTTAADA